MFLIKAFLLSTLLGAALNSDGQPQAALAPVLAVFDIESKGHLFRSDALTRLSEYLADRLAASGQFQLVPRDDLKRRLVEQKLKSHADCVDQKCQIDLGMELAAQKILKSQIIKVGNQCKLTLVFYDLRTSATDGGKTMSCSCNEEGIAEAIDFVLDDLTGSRLESANTEGSSAKGTLQSPGKSTPLTGRLSVDASGMTVYIGLTPVRDFAKAITVPAQAYVVSATSDGSEPFSEIVEVLSGQTTHLKAVPGKEMERADAILEKETRQYPQWQDLAGSPCSLSGDLETPSLHAVGSYSSINPLHGEIVSMADSYFSLANTLSVLRKDLNRKKSGGPFKLDSSGLTRVVVKAEKLRACAITKSILVNDTVLTGIGFVDLHELKYEVGEKLWDEACAFGPSFECKRNPSDGVYTTGAGNVLKFQAEENRCSARLAALLFGWFKMSVMENDGVSVSGELRETHISKPRPGTEPKRKFELVVDASFDSTQKLAKGMLKMKGFIHRHAVEVDRIPKEGTDLVVDKGESEFVVTLTRDGRPAKIVMTDGVISEVVGIDVCTAFSELSEAVRSENLYVDVKDLPDTGFGAALSEVRIGILSKEIIEGLQRHVDEFFEKNRKPE